MGATAKVSYSRIRGHSMTSNSERPHLRLSALTTCPTELTVTVIDIAPNSALSRHRLRAASARSAYTPDGVASPSGCSAIPCSRIIRCTISQRHSRQLRVRFTHSYRRNLQVDEMGLHSYVYHGTILLPVSRNSRDDLFQFG